jgi:tetratricopeptide (TPR) repeat protein
MQREGVNRLRSGQQRRVRLHPTALYQNVNDESVTSLTARPGCRKFAVFVVLIAALTCTIEAQTYSVGPNSTVTPQKNNQSSQAGQPLGWGSNIQNARLARAAELALQRGDHTQAVQYAQRAAESAPNDPQLWFLFGYAARLDGKLALSVQAYEHGLRLNGSAPDGLSGLAQTDSQMGHLPDAIGLLKKVLAIAPGRADDARLLGELYMRSNDYDNAIATLTRSEREQANARSELLLALCYQHEKKMDVAERYLNMARTRDPNNPDVQRSLADYYRQTGEYENAIKALQSIKNPRPDVTAELAFTYQLDGKPSDAARLYAKAANAVPGDMGLQLSAAQAQVSAGNIDQAGPFLKRAAGIDPNFYRLHAVRAEIARQEDRDEDAVREYTAALGQLPANPPEGPLYGIQLHMNLLELDRSLGHDAAARAELATAQTQIAALNEQGSDRAPFLRLRALIKMNAGDLQGAYSDMNEALAINATDPNSLQLDGDLLMKMGKVEEAIAAYGKILAIDPKNRYALTSIGYASRAAGRDQDAQKYFERLAEADPTLYVPWLALGDMYTSHHEYARAQEAYSKAYKLDPKNGLVVAGGINAGIESHNLDEAGAWANRATEAMQREPQILREEERYLSFKGEYSKSEAIGQKAIQVLPRDRDVVVYLGYDMLNLHQYDQLLALTGKYQDVFPKEPDTPLLAGYVEKHDGKLEEARRDFTEALNRDPSVVTAYVNRGYVLNDLHDPKAASDDFLAALKREPKNGEAHLGLAYSYLDLHRPQEAIRQSELAEASLGNSRLVHVIRATAYGREGILSKAATEYRAALKFTPDDAGLHLALGGTLYSEREYHDAIAELKTSERLDSSDPAVYAMLARTYARLDDRANTLQNVQMAEQRVRMVKPSTGSNELASGQSGIYILTGEALSILGDRPAAMQSFRKALTAPGSDRVGVRLAIAQLMATEDHGEDATRQIALALMEAESGETSPPTGEQYLVAADVFRQVHDYQLSETYLKRAQAAGASDTAVRIGMANTYLALGDTARAADELNGISSSAGNEPNYQLLLARANVYRQEHQGPQALTAFAQAANAAGEDLSAEQNLITTAADEGLRVTPHLSLLGDVSTEPVFEDSTVYVLDSKLDAAAPVTQSSLLPPPRSSLETQATVAYHLHLNNFLNRFPTASGFFQERDMRGQISVPATNSIVSRNTVDTSFNFGVNPVLHIGNNVLTFNDGIQATIRRDTLSPIQMNQNLFRQFAYVSTSSFFNAISMDGYVIHETGPFTESNLHSSAFAAAVDFRIGAPWGKTALVTGWGENDQSFSPVGIEDYYTSSYVGVDHHFNDRVDIKALAEDLRAWRIVGTRSGISQAFRPAAFVSFIPKRHWTVQAQAAYSNTVGFHDYDAIQSGFSVSYALPVHRGFRDENGDVVVEYPIRFSGGLQQETFSNFPGVHSQQLRPYFSISLF